MLHRLTILLLTCAVLAYGQSLSKKDIVDLKKAGVSDDLVIKQVEANGVSFQLSAPELIELKNSGISERVLNAIVSGKPNRSSDPSANFREMYASGNFDLLVRSLRSHLAANPMDERARTMLALTLLRVGERASARVELQQLQNGRSEVAQQYAQKIEKAFKALEANDRTKTKIRESLTAYDVKLARAAIGGLQASHAQQEYLNAILDMYEAKFDSVRSRLVGLETNTLGTRQASTARQLLDRLGAHETEYKRRQATLDGYLHSPVIPALCDTRNLDVIKSISISEFANLVDQLAAAAPLSSDTLSLQFFRLMLTSKDFSTFENVGKAILKANGRVTLPFYAQDRFFDLVIDADQQRIYTRDNPRPFSAAWQQKRWPTNAWNSELVPFDVRFDDIVSVFQNTGSNHSGAFFTPNYGIPGRKLYALRLQPGGGTAPHYAFMHHLHCVAGQGAQQIATRNLGQFVVDLAPRSAALSKIVTPEEKFGSGGELMLGIASVNSALYEAAGGASGTLTDVLNQKTIGLAQQSIAAAENQRVTAQAMLESDWLNDVTPEAFDEIEKLLGLV